jgi:hypothetical protein
MAQIIPNPLDVNVVSGNTVATSAAASGAVVPANSIAYAAYTVSYGGGLGPAVAVFGPGQTILASFSGAAFVSGFVITYS